MRQIYLITIIVLLISSLIMAETVPEDNAVKGWIQEGTTLRFPANELYGHIDGGAELFLEFGFDELLVQRYIHDGLEIDMEIYRMSTPLAALGIYLIRKGNEKPVDGVKARSTGNQYQITALKGRDYIQINNLSGEAAILPDMIQMLNLVLGIIPDAHTPDVFNVLPTENKITGSEMIMAGPYALQPIFTFGEGNILGLSDSLYAVAADYGSDSNRTTRLIIDYKTVDRAAKIFENLKRNLDPYLKIVMEKENSFVIADYYDQFDLIVRDNNLISIHLHLTENPYRGH